MWKEINLIKQQNSCKMWYLLGDFNFVRKPEERKGIGMGRTNGKEIREFNNFIDKTSVNDISAVGRKYTWYRPNGTAKSRLDRILLTNEWLEKWPESKQHILDRVISDHCALVLKREQIDWGPKPFRSLEAWHSVSGFRKFVETKWGTYNVYGDGLSKLKEKFKKLKKDLKLWNRDVFGYVNLQKQNIINKIRELDKLDNESTLEDDQRVERIKLFSELSAMSHVQEAIWKQNSRAKLIGKGDSNSKYFRSIVSWRRKKNELKGVDILGQLCEKPDVVKVIVKDYFKQRLTDSIPLQIRF